MLDAFLSDFTNPFSELPWQVALGRMLAAMVLGGLIGWEREVHLKSAGLRTHMLVALAACLFTLVAFDLMAVTTANPGALRVDPLRLIEAVTAGVAFLAAGVVFSSPEKTRGLTTGAGLWLAGAIGLTCGVGNMPLAAIATVAALIVLLVIHWLASAVGPKGDDTTVPDTTAPDGGQAVRPPPR